MREDQRDVCVREESRKTVLDERRVCEGGKSKMSGLYERGVFREVNP